MSTLMPQTMGLLQQRGEPALLGRTPEKLPSIESAFGIYLVDDLGNQFIDGISGAYAAVLGYSHPAMRAALADCGSVVPFVHNARFSNIWADELAEKLTEHFVLPDHRVYFSVSGADGLEAAMRISHVCAPPERKTGTFCSLRFSYHGATLGGLSASGHLKARQDYVGALKTDSVLVPAPLDGASIEDCLSAVEQAIREKPICAMIVEPVMGNAAGSAPLPTEYLVGVQQLCTAHGVGLIADEITSGFGRTGPALASKLAGLSPDITVVGKALTAGYFPISAALVSPSILERLPLRFTLLGHSHSAQPIGARLGLAAVNEIERLRPRIDELAAHLNALLTDGLKGSAVVEIQGRGLLYSIKLDPSYRIFQGRVSPSTIAYERALKEGLLTMPGSRLTDSGTTEEHLTIAPAYSMTDGELEEMITRLARALE